VFVKQVFGGVVVVSKNGAGIGRDRINQGGDFRVAIKKGFIYLTWGVALIGCAVSCTTI
jgi:hypothetical protein